MRKIILGGIITVTMLFSNCSKDDANSQGTDNYVRNYLPLNIGNSWSYTFSRDLNGSNSEGIEDTQIESVENDAYTWQKGGNMYLQPDQDIIVEKNDGVYSSDIKIPVELFGVNDLDLELKGFVLLNEDASIEEEFYADEFVYNTEPEFLEDQGTGFSGNVVANIKLIGNNQLINKLQSKTGLSSVFEDVLETRADISLEVSLDIEGSIPVSGITIPVNLTHMLITEQKIGDLVQFYANDVGLIESVSDFDLRNLQIDTTVNLIQGLPPIDINTLIEGGLETDYYFKEEFRLND